MYLSQRGGGQFVGQFCHFVGIASGRKWVHFERGTRVKFLSSIIRQGCLVMKCADEATKVWLMKVSLLLEEPKIMAVEGDISPKPTVVTMWVPAREVVNPRSILSRIAHQNNLDIIKWRIIKVYVEQRGCLFVLAIDNSSLEQLRNANMFVFHAMDCYGIKLRGGGGRIIKVNIEQRGRLFVLAIVNNSLEQLRNANMFVFHALDCYEIKLRGDGGRSSDPYEP
uniref:DUF4780 domain-containing protein n=1 Tax=Lutzomyia longipalpis TaxID=7200 RepID=A0A1B0GKN6_LUTLO